METFFNKITIEKPAYHNQFGIAVTTIACVYIVYSVFREFKLNPTGSEQPNNDLK